MDITLRMSDHALTARAAAAAGIVLLKNTAGTLPLLRAWLLDCGYGGMLWGDRTLAGDRIGLEKAALRILRLILQLKKA